MADDTFPLILSCMLREKAKGVIRFQVTTAAGLDSLGGQAAVKGLGEALEDHF